MNREVSPAPSALDLVLQRREWLAWLHGALAFVAAFSFWFRPTALHKLHYGPWSGHTLLVYTGIAWVPMLISWAISRQLIIGSRTSFRAFVVVLLVACAAADLLFAGA